MEIIELAGYSEEQKLEIARRYLMPKQVKEHGISPEAFDLPEETLRTIIERYTREAGVRNLEREIATICRHAARRIAEGKTQIAFTPQDLDDLLGAPRFHYDTAEAKDEVGVATGMAWTPVGGDILFVEARAVPGHGGLILTGHLGEVMRESAQAGLTYLRSRAEALGLPENFHEKFDIHVHVPAGAIPKDGPSAGVTIASAMISALTRRPILHNVAMTGEITLRGRVLPVGGIPDKILAAHRAGLNTIVLPRENERDLNEIPEPIRRDLTFILVEHMDELLRAVLQPEVVTEEPNLEPVGAGLRPA
jgi:ATP-dependent Lon protease